MADASEHNQKVPRKRGIEAAIDKHRYPAGHTKPKIRNNGWITELKADWGYTKPQIAETMQVLISLPLGSLYDIQADPNNTVLERVVARALIRSYEKGDLTKIEILLTRMFGAPQQNIEANVRMTKFDVKFNDEEAPIVIDITPTGTDGNNIP